MKEAIRKKILIERDRIPADIKPMKDSLIKKMLFSLPEFVSARTIIFYASFRSEVETLDMIKESIKMGKKVVLPKVDKKRHMLVLYEIKEMKELIAGYMGIPEPSLTEGRLVSVDNADLIVIPGAGFDYSGNRLGYGAGYYDILLSQRKKKMPIIALSYEEQLVDYIPSEDHDVKVEIIVTDKRLIRITRKK